MQEKEKQMKQSYHHGNLRTELIETGIKAIQSEGIEKLSLRRLAALCGVSEAAPYKHFANKEELLSAMQEHITEQLMACLQEAGEKTDVNDPTAAILNMGKAYVIFFMNNHDYYDFLFLKSNIIINLSMEDEAGNYPAFQYFKEKCFEVYRNLKFSDERIKYGIISMWAKVHGLAAISSMKNVVKDFEWENVLDKILIE